MNTIKKGDFVELDYIGRVVASGRVFDTSLAEVAKQEGAFNPQQRYGPVVICVGERQLVPGIDVFLAGKEIGKEYEVELEPEMAFGKRSGKLVQLTSLSKFKGQEMRPFPGARFMIDNMPAVVKSVSGGRVILDFNHPLAGQRVRYWVKINKIVTDVKKQAEAVFERLGLPEGKYSIELKDEVLRLKVDDDLKKLLEAGLKEIERNVKRLVMGIDKVELESS